MGLLLWPLHGALFIVSTIAHVLVIAAFIGALTQPADAFLSADKMTKLFWLLALFIGFFLVFIGVIAALVYFLDVRPAVEAASGGGGGRSRSSSDGPYGPPPPRR